MPEKTEVLTERLEVLIAYYENEKFCGVCDERENCRKTSQACIDKIREWVIGPKEEGCSYGEKGELCKICTLQDTCLKNKGR